MGWKAWVIGILLAVWGVSATYLYLSSNNQIERLEKNLSEMKEALERLNLTYNSLKEDYSRLSLQHNKTKQRLLSCQQTLSNLSTELSRINERYSSLLVQYEQLESNLSELAYHYNLSQQTLSNLTEELEWLNAQLTDYMEWFRENSRISSDLDIIDPCYKGYTLNVPCLVYMLEKQEGYRYLWEDGDKLKSLEEIARDGGGDCEDWTLLVNAYIRALEPESIELMKDGEGTFTIYKTSTKRYYYLAKEPYYVDYVHVYGVCYWEGPVTGHCVSLLTDQIPPNITRGVLFEPQSGAYLGELGERIDICGDCSPYDTYRIMIIFGEDDLYIYRDGRWISYGILKRELSQYLKNLYK